VSPTAVGIDQQHLRDLANQYLANNPFKASWQDPKRSYFDEATMRFGGKITLIEHRRCVPEIIGFSNKIAYEPDNIRLIPVRQRPSDALTPIRRVHVANGYERGRGINPAEADAIVEQVVACAADPAYAGKTFGVISLMGKEQAKYIAGLLLGRLTPEEWTTRDLRCGDAADFQGSERDVIFLSMVKAADGGRLGALTQEMYVQRYNVAASRAKDQMWLFHSVLLSDLGNPEDMRHALLDYVTNVETRQDETDDRIRTDLAPEDFRIQPFDSLFEQRVFNRIHGRGYSVIPQYPAEGYNIDLVVVGGNGNLAIECDGDTWHGPEHYLKDLARQRDLERCGWTFFRVRESAYYLDPDAALADLWGKLDDLNREPEAVKVIANATPSAPSRDRQANIQLTTVEAYGAGSAPAPSPAPEAIALDHAPAPASAMSTMTEAPTVDVVAPPVDQPSSSRYQEFTGRTTPTHLASKGQIIDSVVEVVRAEGPVRGSRLLTAYVRAAGGQKVGSQIAHDLNSAITAAVRQGRLIEHNPLNEPGVKGKTYRLPDQPPFLIRGLGQRSLDDVPPLELAARIELARRRVGPHASREELFRAVLDRLGLKRLTPNVEDLLTRAAGIRINEGDAE
jgi:very-short-patch-repair endonuclease